jgi:hypothetical protein
MVVSRRGGLILVAASLAAVAVVAGLLWWSPWREKPRVKEEPERSFAGSSDLLK